MHDDVAFVVRFHACFATVAAALLGPTLLPTPPYRTGLAVCGLVFGWHLAFAASAASRERRGLYEMWRFLAMLSVMMVVPDWFLADVLGTLVFPEHGAPRIGAVNMYMAGMWSIPLSWVLVCFTSTQREPSWSELLGASALALLILGASEQLTVPLQLWLATDRVAHTAGHVALYVLPAEAMLGAITLCAHRATATLTGWDGTARRVLAAGAVALQYTGALAVSYLFVEGRDTGPSRLCYA